MAKPRACRSTLKLKEPVDTDPATLARRATQKRLSKARLGLEAFVLRLQALHADKTGSALTYYGRTVPLVSSEASGKLDSIARTKREAAEGCELCAAWLEETADLRELVETLRNIPLPAKDPSYTGWPLTLSAVNRLGKVRTVSHIRTMGRVDVATVLKEREARSAERKARGAALFKEFGRDVEEAAIRKAAGNVPH